MSFYAGEIQVEPYLALTGLALCAAAHMEADRVLTTMLLKARGVERKGADYEYPFPVPTFPLLPAPEDRSPGAWVSLVVRELLVGWVRVALIVAGCAFTLAQPACGTTRFFALMAVQLPTGLLVLVLLLRVALSQDARGRLWCVLLLKFDLVRDGKRVIDEGDSAFTVLSRLVRSALYLIAYSSVLSLVYLIVGSEQIQSCNTNSKVALTAMLVLQLVAGPLMLLYAHAYVKLAVHLDSKLAADLVPRKLAHSAFVYFCGPLRVCGITRRSARDLDEARGESLRGSQPTSIRIKVAESKRGSMTASIQSMGPFFRSTSQSSALSEPGLGSFRIDR
jgi:hypothetical protein